jgi:hypothetical protein
MQLSLRNKVLAAAVSGMALAALAAGPAQAATTTATFTLTGAGLSISAPSATNLSASTNIGTTSLSAALGTVTVTDARGGLLGSWTATVSSTDFVTNAQSASNTISKANASYWSGVATPGVGQVAVPIGQQLLSVNAVALDVQRTAVSTTGVTGNAVVTWNPTVGVTVPTDVVAGTYTGTITHSVA